METLDVFSVRDLHTRSSDLLRDAELGQLALITKHGRPVILAVPFDRRLLDQGVNSALALTLFENRQLTLAQTAKVAGSRWMGSSIYWDRSVWLPWIIRPRSWRMSWAPPVTAA